MKYWLLLPPLLALWLGGCHPLFNITHKPMHKSQDHVIIGNRVVPAVVVATKQIPATAATKPLINYTLRSFNGKLLHIKQTVKPKLTVGQSVLIVYDANIRITPMPPPRRSKQKPKR